MKVNTKQRKKARAGFEQAVGKEEMVNAMFHIIQVGKQALDTFVYELGVKVGISTRLSLHRGSEGLRDASPHPWASGRDLP